MIEQQELAIGRKGAWAAVRRSQAHGHIDGPGFAAGDIVKIRCRDAVGIEYPGRERAIGRKLAGLRLPLRVGNPFQLLGGDIQQGDILVSALLVGVTRMVLPSGETPPGKNRTLP